MSLEALHSGKLTKKLAHLEEKRISTTAMKQHVEKNLNTLTPGISPPGLRSVNKTTPERPNYNNVAKVFQTGTELFHRDSSPDVSVNDQYGVLSRRSKDVVSLQHSVSSVSLVQNRFETIQKKQEREFERFKR